MKQLFITLILALMSVTLSMPASAKTGNVAKSYIPQNIIVRQTTCFNEGRTLVLYYKKQGNQCEVYSTCDEKDYDLSDVNRIKSTSFEVVSKVEGKLYRKTTVCEFLKALRKVVDTYLQ